MNRRVDFLVWFFCVLIFASVCGGWDSDAEKDGKQVDPDSFVTELGPGKKLYGRTPEFAEIGNASMFDLSPDGQKIAFMSSKGIRFWDIEKKKLDDSSTGDRGSTGYTPGQHFEYSADGLKLFTSTWEQSAPQMIVDDDDDEDEDEDSDEEESQTVPSVSPSQVIEVRSAITGDVITKIVPVADKKESRRNVSFVLPSPDGDKVVLGFGQRTEIYDAQTGELIRKLKHDSWMQSAVFDHEGKRLIDGRGKIVDLETGDTDGKLPRMIFGQYLNALKYHPKKNMLAATEWSKGVTLYDFDKKEKIELESAKSVAQQHLYSIEFSSDGKLLAGASYANWQTQKGRPMLIVWDIDSGKIVDEIELTGGYISRFRISHDNKTIYAKSNGQYGLSRYPIDGDRKPASNVRAITNPIQHFRFVDGEDHLMACPAQGDAVMFDLETGEPLHSVSCQNNSHLEFAKSGKYVVLAANYGQFKIHNTESGKSKNVQVKSFTRPSVVSRLGSFLTRKKRAAQWENFAIGSVSVADDHKHVLVALRGSASFRWQKFRLDNGESVEQKRFKYSDYWDLEDDDKQNITQFHWARDSVAVSPNMQLFAMFGPEDRIYVFDADSGNEMFDLPITNFQHGSSIFFSRDSEKLYVKTQDKLTIVDIESGEESGAIKVSASYRFGLSSDRTKLALLMNNPNRVVVYDLDSEEEVFSKKVDQSYLSVGVSNDAEKMAFARSNCQFEVWDVNEIE